MSIHQNKRLWQKHVLAENRRSLEGLLDTLCDEPVYTIMATGEEHRGKDAVAAFYRGLFEAAPDATFDLINVFVAEEGVVEESVLRGTHRGKWMGVEATGRQIQLPLIIVFPMKNGQILGERLYFDLGTLLKSLGRL
ncbi:MAG TPA: ester cyclase [Anaerolineae bacterium]|nr:ester cyclase [Anaerolineae bacterium]